VKPLRKRCVKNGARRPTKLTEKIFRFETVHFKAVRMSSLTWEFKTIQTIVVCVHKNFRQNFNEIANLCRNDSLKETMETFVLLKVSLVLNPLWNS
jgi:hypothetical protein